jgi:hypothetical protein
MSTSRTTPSIVLTGPGICDHQDRDDLTAAAVTDMTPASTRRPRVLGGLISEYGESA